ncbi:MAG: ABC-2 type transport system permease protein [Candidatus Poriferisodalaceae bacterium]|jgi:ABC-2 type transport system permease protein
MTPFKLLWRLFLADLLTKGRLAALGVLGAAVVLIAWAVARTNPEDPITDAVLMLTSVGLALMVPLISLVFSSASLGNLKEDKTLVHVWLTPIAPWIVPAAALTAALTVVLPPVVVSMAAAAAIFGAGSGLVIATAIVALLAATTYCAMFTLLGGLLKRALLWGLGYVLIWEGIVAGAGTTAARLSIRVYTTSLLYRLNNLKPSAPANSTAAAVVVLLAVIGTAAAFTVRNHQQQTVD